MNIDEARTRLRQLQNQSKFEKMLGVCSVLTGLTEQHRLKPIIVGGFAVEIYSRSEYTTVDIDLVFRTERSCRSVSAGAWICPIRTSLVP